MRTTFSSSSLAALLLAALLLVPSVICPSPADAQNWVQYVDESAGRIVADPSLGTADTFEKDLISGDVDKDGDVDLIVARKVRFSTAGGKANVLFMNEDGVMTDRTASLAPDFLDLTDDRDVILVDVDGDTWLDVVTATTFSDQPRVLMNLGQNAGGWLGFAYDSGAGRLPTFVPGPKFCAVAAGDVDNDGDQDLFFVDYDNTLEDRLLINNGTGFFTDVTSTQMTAANSFSAFGTDAQIEDMNGDGFKDIVKDSTLGDSPNSIRILYNDPLSPGFFVTPLQHIFTDSPYMMEVADFNNDGRMDVYAVSDGQDASLINTGNDAQGRAQFTTTTVTQSPNSSGLGGNVKFADLDRDGVLDVLLSDVDTDIQNCPPSSSTNLVLLQGRGSVPSIFYQDPWNGAARGWLPRGTFDVEALDVDGDGLLDIWAGTCEGNLLFMDPQIIVAGFEAGDFSEWDSVFP